MNVTLAELQGPLFLNGTNLSQRLDTARREGLKMVIDKCQGLTMLRVTYKTKSVWVPMVNVAFFECDEALPVEVAPKVGRAQPNSGTFGKAPVMEG